jgi:hypothetical protein
VNLLSDIPAVQNDGRRHAHAMNRKIEQAQSLVLDGVLPFVIPVGL